MLYRAHVNFTKIITNGFPDSSSNPSEGPEVSAIYTGSRTYLYVSL